MPQSLIKLVELIRQAWIKTTLEEYDKRKHLWWIERDLTDHFQYFLKPVIELIPDYELFSEWYYKLAPSKGGNKKIDFAIVEPVYSGNKATSAFIRIVIEIKWIWDVNSKLQIERLDNDAKALTKMITQGGLKSKRGDVVCEGNKPDHALLLLFYDADEIEDTKRFIEQYKKDYPLVTMYLSIPERKE